MQLKVTISYEGTDFDLLIPIKVSFPAPTLHNFITSSNLS
jgi:hypothetical protein